MASTTTTGRKRKGRGNIQKKANGSYLGRLRISGYDTFYVTGTSEKSVKITYDTYVHTDLDRAFSAVQSLE